MVDALAPSGDSPAPQKLDPADLPRLPDGRADWDALWTTGVTPWDMGEPSPPLVAWLREGRLPTGRRVLLPGCGRAYEARLLAEAGYEVVGVDLSPQAVAAAHAALPDLPRVSILLADMIADVDRIAATPFDWAFDQTFFCAIEPRDRAPAAAALARSLRTGGELWALTFQTQNTACPPYHTDPDEYANIHIAAGFELIEIRPVGDISHAARRGRETLVRLRRAG